MANLWRTQRPRFPLYQSDGLGRDYYIKFTNGGFWEDQFVLSKKPDYLRPKYSNFHSLFHMAAPFKYWGDGSGRENYILKCNGFIHDQKPLCSYTLTDFLRNGKNFQGMPINYGKKLYLSLSEIKYNQQLKNLQKKLVKRLYTEPMKKKKKIKIEIDNGNKDKYGNSIPLKNFGYKTCGHFNSLNKNINAFEDKKDNLTSDKKENSYDNKFLKNSKTLENNTFSQKFKNNLKMNNYKKYANTLNTLDINNNYDMKQKKIRKIQFLTQKNNQLKNRELCKDIYDEAGFKKAVVGGKLINKKIKII